MTKLENFTKNKAFFLDRDGGDHWRIKNIFQR